MASFTRKTLSTAKPSAPTELLELYAQIDYSKTPFEILGLPHTESRSPKNIKAAYHALARRIHPDKCQPGQTDLHTRLFKRVQDAYEQAMQQQSILSKEPRTPTRNHPKTKSPGENEEPTSNPEHSQGAHSFRGYRTSPAFDTEHMAGATYNTGYGPSANRVPLQHAATSRSAYARPAANSAWSSEELCEDL